MVAYISEVDYDGGAASNFVEIVVPQSMITANFTLVIYDNNGTVRASFVLDTPITTMWGNNVYLVDSSKAGWIDLKNTDAVALVNSSGSVAQFIAFKDPVTATAGPASGMAATQVGQHSGSNQSLQTANDGNTYSAVATSTAGTIACFAPGTLIDTPTGAKCVETLMPGDTVTTRDRGPQIIRWISHEDHLLTDAQMSDLPVLIKAGALGQDLPRRDIVVSPQHRIFAGGGGQLKHAFSREVLVPAKSLTALNGIRHMTGKSKITWVHFACDRHEIITANGCLTESLLLGPMTIGALTALKRRALFKIFGTGTRHSWAQSWALNGPPARECLTVGQARHALTHQHMIRPLILRGGQHTRILHVH